MCCSPTVTEMCEKYSIHKTENYIPVKFHISFTSSYSLFLCFFFVFYYRELTASVKQTLHIHKKTHCFELPCTQLYKSRPRNAKYCWLFFFCFVICQHFFCLFVWIINYVLLYIVSSCSIKLDYEYLNFIRETNKVCV